MKKGTKQKIASPSLKRSAAGTTLPTSPEKPRSELSFSDLIDRHDSLEKHVAIVVAHELAKFNAAEFLDQTIPFLREIILRQMKTNRIAPKNADEAGLRSRDGSIFSGLVKTLERLDKLDRSRTIDRKTKKRTNAELKQEFLRRLDQLLASGPKTSVPGEPERG